MKPIIRAENLSKQYRIGEERLPYVTLRESLARSAKAPFRRWSRNGSPERNTIWALQDVGFEVRPGEVVGVIGRNGAGKSTLLKILSRVTEPTRGGVDLYGRMGSLLEVGTGFHPELTGRENIFLNGAILGMRRDEIRRRFDEIVAFAQIDQFLDTPVKRYSSGMYTRLAFAVAAHLQTEILVIDEVLAVGDANFQKRCLGKLEEAGHSGRTVLFVSHNMPMVHRLCPRTLLLDRGALVADGPSEEVIHKYLHSDTSSPAECAWTNPDSAPGDAVARLKSVRVLNEQGEPAETLDVRDPVLIEVEYWQLAADARPTVSLHFTNEDGICLFVSNDFNNQAWWLRPRTRGIVRATCVIPGNYFAEGRLFLLAALCSYNPNRLHALERDVISFQMIDQSQGDGVRGVYAGAWPGIVRPMLRWDVATVENRRWPGPDRSRSILAQDEHASASTGH